MAGVEGERELEEFIGESGVLRPDDQPVIVPPESEEETTPPSSPEPDEVVRDDGPRYRPLPDEEDHPPAAEETLEEETPPDPEEDDPENTHVSWAQKKYGEDTDRWARGLYEQEQMISRLGAEKRHAEEVATEAIKYARQVEASAQSGPMGMPLSASEEMWVEQNMANPSGAAYQAARAGNVQLYRAVIERVAEDNPQMAADIGTQVQLALAEEARQYQAQQQQQAAAAQQNGGQGNFQAEMAQSFQDLGIDVSRYGPAMNEKVAELGEYHPYTLAILGGDRVQRNLALQAIYDLVRQGSVVTRRVTDQSREDQIRREGELRREAASVVTGSPHVAAPKQSDFFSAMEDEWRRRGQWRD